LPLSYLSPKFRSSRGAIIRRAFSRFWPTAAAENAAEELSDQRAKAGKAFKNPAAITPAAAFIAGPAVKKRRRESALGRPWDRS